MIQLIKANGLTYGAGAIQIINKYGKPKTAGAGGTVWGTITGTITDQTDLISYLSGNYYPLSSNPAGYLTSITSSDVTTALGYTPYSNTNPSGFITSAALTPYLTSASAALTYYPLSNPSGYINGITSSDVTTALGFTPYNATNPAGYIDSSALAPYLTSASAALTYYPLTNPNGYITSSALTPYLTSATAAATYQPIGSYLTTISGLNISLLNNDTGYITSAALSGYLTLATAASTYFPIPTGTTSQYLRGDGSVATFPTIPSVTPSALTKTDDTNVTLTLGGSPSNALLAGVSLTLGWTGTLADSRIASASTWNAKQDALSGTGFVVSTGGVISYDTNTYYLASNPAGYIDSSALSSYVPYTGGTSDVDLGAYNMTAAKFIVPGGTPNDFLKADGSLDSTVYYNASNPAGYITSSSLSGYVPYTGATSNLNLGTYTITTPTVNGVSGALEFANAAQTSGSIIPFKFTVPSNTGQTASTNTPNFKVVGTTKQFATGALTAQYFNHFSANTLSFVGASVATEVFNGYFETNIAGTNATITNNYALGTNGNVKFDDGTSKFIWRAVPTVPSYSGIFLNVSPNSSNYALVNDGSGNTFLNGTSSVYVSANATNVARFGTVFQLHTPIAATSGSIIKWQLTVPADTGMTASTNIPNFKITGNTKQFATGALATQYFNYITANTLSFVGASTATDVFNLFVEKPIAGTNATITNNFAIGTNGSIKVGENLNLAGISSASKSQVLTYDTTTKNVSYFTFSGTMFKDTTNSSDLTGTTEQIVKSVLIPANTFTIGDDVWIEVRNRKVSSAGATNHYIKINTSNSLTSAMQVGILNTTATGFLAGFYRSLIIKSATVTEIAGASYNSATDLGQPTSASDLNIDWTVNQYIIISIQNATGTDTCRNSYLLIQKR